MAKTKSKKKKASEKNDDWISALAKQATTKEPLVLSKAERIERRKAKKRRREERKPTSSSAHATRQDADLFPKKMNRSREAQLENLAKHVQKRVHSLRNTSGPYISGTTKKGKATAGSQLNEDVIQPRRRDYGGLGLSRPSLFIALRDPSFVPKLEEEFAEHVPGFFGKQRTKAMKRQLDGNMLWRQLAEKRTDDRTLGGKKLSDMNPDERVEAMIKAGMI